LTTNHYNNFISQFFINKEQTEYILFKKLNVLFDTNKIKLYTKSELNKINKIVLKCKISVDIISKLFNKFNTENITEYNASRLLLYLRDIDEILRSNIKWGSGNNNNANENIINHFKKHVLCPNEGKYWVKILDKIDCYSYEKYTIDSFSKMKKVLIHTDGVDVYLSGFHNDIFIVGRYDNDAFTISSCYYVESGEKFGRYKGLCLKS